MALAESVTVRDTRAGLVWSEGQPAAWHQLPWEGKSKCKFHWAATEEGVADSYQGEEIPSPFVVLWFLTNWGGHLLYKAL